MPRERRQFAASSRLLHWTMAAMILERQSKKVDAQKRYEQIVAALPRAAVAANNLAWIYADAGTNLDEAAMFVAADPKRRRLTEEELLKRLGPMLGDPSLLARHPTLAGYAGRIAAHPAIAKVIAELQAALDASGA